MLPGFRLNTSQHGSLDWGGWAIKAACTRRRSLLRRTARLLTLALTTTAQRQELGG
jgi:hypothetical protein